MPLTGKYDFPGIKKFGARGLSLVLASFSWGAWLIQWGFGPVIDFLFKEFSNWLANKGLIVLNIGAIVVEGEFNQKSFDKAMEEGLHKVLAGGLTDQQKKEIDDKVIKAARRFLVFTRTNPK